MIFTNSSGRHWGIAGRASLPCQVERTVSPERQGTRSHGLSRSDIPGNMGKRASLNLPRAQVTLEHERSAADLAIGLLSRASRRPTG